MSRAGHVDAFLLEVGQRLFRVQRLFHGAGSVRPCKKPELRGVIEQDRK